MNKRIGVISKNYKGLLESLESSIFAFYKFGQILETDDEVTFDFVIIDTKNSFESLKRLKAFGIISDTTPCLIISNNLKEHPSQILISTHHKGVLSVFRNYYNDYSGLSQQIRSALNPQLPVKQARFLFILPVYNEESRINHVTDFLNILLKIIKTQKLDAKVRFVNDGSCDDTPALINRILKNLHVEMKDVQIDDFLEIENLEENTQKAGIYNAGFRNSNSNYYFILDSDNSFFEEDIVKAISIIEDGYYDLIQATKDQTAEKRKLIRKVLSFFKRICTKLFLPHGVSDSQTGFKVLNANVARQAMPYVRDEYGFAADLQLLNICKKMKFRALQLPVKCVDQEGSHVDPIKDAKRFLMSLIKIAFKKEVYHDFK